MPFSATLRSRPLWRTVLAALLAAALTPALRAATTLGPDGAEILVDQNSPAALLGPEYKDDAHGFRVCPPYGVTILDRAGLDLLAFIHDTKKWTGSVQLVALTNDLDTTAYAKAAIDDLSKNFKAVQVLESKTITVGAQANPPTPGKPAAKFVVTFQVDPPPPPKGVANPPVRLPENLLRQDLAVQLDKKQYILLTMTAPLASKVDAIRTFNAMVDTFEAYGREEIANRRKAAVIAGRDFLVRHTPEELATRIVKEPQYFRVKLDNKDVGYLRFDEKETDYLGFKGVEVVANARSFPPDGSAVLGSNIAFWAHAKQPDRPGVRVRFSAWTNNVKSVVFPVRAQPQEAWSIETGTLAWENPNLSPRKLATAPALAEKDDGVYVMTVSRNTGKNATILNERGQPVPVLGSDAGISKPFRYVLKPPEPDVTMTAEQRRALPPPPDPLPKTLEYLWPRVVDLKKNARYAFIVFNTATNNLGLRTLSVLGPQTITIDGKSVHATKLLDELAPGSTTIWVDDAGRPLMMATSDKTTLTRTTEAEMYRLWKARLKQLPGKIRPSGDGGKATPADELFSDY